MESYESDLSLKTRMVKFQDSPKLYKIAISKKLMGEAATKTSKKWMSGLISPSFVKPPSDPCFIL